MKLSISSFAWLPEEAREVADILKKNNIRYIDTTPLYVTESLDSNLDKKVYDFKNFWSLRNIKALGLQSLFYEKRDSNFFESEESTLLSIDYFRKIARFSTLMDIKILVFGSPKQRNLFNGIDNNVNLFFKEISKICLDHDLIFCIEPNASSYGTNFLTNTHEAADFVKSLRLKNVKINFDTGCDIMNGLDPIETYEKYADIIGHIHLSSPNLAHVDEYTLNHSSFYKILKNKNYNEGLSIEMFRNNNDPLYSIKNSINVLCSYYRN